MPAKIMQIGSAILKTLDVVASVLGALEHIRGFTTMRYINLRFTYLLTYLPCIRTSLD